MEPIQPLHSERGNRARTLGASDLAELTWKRIAYCRDQLWHFREALSGWVEYGFIEKPPRLGDVDEYLIRRLKTSNVAGRELLDRDSAPVYLSIDGDLLLDVVELLYLDVVSAPVFVGNEPSQIEGFDKDRGQEEFREQVNTALGLAEPPLELLSNGHVIDAENAHRDLYENPLPDNAGADLADPVRAALDQFLSRGATDQDKRAAVKHLLDVLERIRPEVKEEMLKKDEQEMFRLANKFALRHYDREQISGYDKAIWLDWSFHVILATIRAVLAVRERDSD